MGRSGDRSGFELPTRMHLAESDLDAHEHDLLEIRTELRSEMASFRRVLVGVLVSVTTAAVLLALNAILLGVR